ncbi:MAG TPA: ATP-binding protein [Polyangiales bacterium]|nr:ATP-binding protein [Polyangiales bacterium]
MPSHRTPQSVPQGALRQRAERKLHESGEIDLAKVMDALDAPALLHDLRVHEIELHMQNEALEEANARLEQAEAMYRDLYEHAPIAYVTLGTSAVIKSANRAALKLLRSTPQELVGTKLSTFVAPEHALLLARHRNDVRSRDDVAQCRIELDVRGRRLRVRLESVRDAQDHETARVAIIDETPQLEHEHLSRDYKLVTDILDAAGLLVLLDASGRIVRVNGGFRRAFCGEQRVEGLPFWRVFGKPEERDVFTATLERLLRMGGTCEWDSTSPVMEGAEHTVRWAATLLAHGEAQHVVLIGDDLTERRELESRLLAADRLAAMGTLAAGIGHEINNPLAYLMASLELAQRTLSHSKLDQASQEVEQLRCLHGTALEGAQRIAGIVDELRSLARCDQKVLEGVDVRKVLDSCIQLAGHEVRYRSRLVKEYHDVALVRANPNRLAQVFLNLLINAAQALPQDAPERNVIRLSVRDEAEHVVVEVHDSGSGIAPEHKARIFDPFFTTKPVGEGMGLGLSVCHSIVTGFGGTIEVDSMPGEGCTFRVRLPKATADVSANTKPQAERASKTARQLRPMRVLVVDDEPSLVSSLALMLDDHTVETASTVDGALDRCRDHAYDVILCDMRMPHRGGEELYRELKVLRPGQEKRVVFMSGGAFTQRIRDFLLNVPNRVLSKPFTFDELSKLLDEVGNRSDDRQG